MFCPVVGRCSTQRVDDNTSPATRELFSGYLATASIAAAKQFTRQLSPSPKHRLPRYRKILLRHNGGAGETHATWVYGKTQSQTRSGSLAVSLVRDRSWRQTSLPQEDCRHRRALPG